MQHNKRLTLHPLGWCARYLLLTVFFLSLTGIVKADNEPDNNAPGTTTDILVPGGSSQSGSIDASADPDDYYSVTTSADGDLNVSITTSNGNLVYYYLYDNDGTTILSSSYLYGGSSNFTMNGIAAGSYYVRIYASSNSNTYTVSTTLTPPPYSIDTEPNNLYTQALTLNENDTVFGHITYRYNGGTFDYIDWYKLTTTVDGNLTIGITTTTANLVYFDLYDADGTTSISTNHYLYGGNASYVVNGLAAGDYYIKVFTTGNGYNSYKLYNSKTLPLYNQDTEPNGQYTQALNMNLNDSTEGHIGHYNNLALDTMDWYKIVTPQDGDLNLTITTENGNLVYYYLYDNDGSTILGGTYLYGGNSSSTITGLAAGTYYARVYATNYNSYRLRNTFTPPPYSNDTEPNGLYTQALTLNENDSVFGHLSYRYNGGTFDNPDWYKLTTTVDGNITIGMTSITSNIVYFDLYDADGTTGISTNHYLYGGNASYVVNGLAAGDYYVKVYTTGNGYNSYKLYNSVVAPLYGQDTEPNGLFAQALTLNVNDSTEGHIGHYNNLALDTMDWYKIVTPQDGDLSLTITTETGNLVYYNLYDNDGVTLLNSAYLYGGSSNYSVNGLAAGTYYVRVYATNYNSYRLKDTLILPPYANDIEPNNSFATAYRMNNRPTRTGHIAYRENGGTFDTDDYYKITMYSAGDCSFDIQMANGHLCYFSFYNSAQTLLFNNYLYGGTYSFNFTSLAAGDYYFRVSTTSGNYNSYNITNFSVPCNPASAVITAGGPTTFCIPGSVTLNTQDPGEYASFLWSNSETTADITVSTSGTYSVTATDWDGCVHTSNAITTTAVSPPAANITPSGSTTFCQGGSVDLQASAGASWLWSNGATTQTINVTASGTFTVTVTNAQGCSATSAGTTVTVNPLPTVTLNPFSAVCTSDPVFALTGGSPSGGTYSGTGVSGGNFDPAAAGVGTFLITYSYTDGNGCSAEASQLITVNNCGSCTASITPGGSTTFCNGGSVILTASAGASYLWSTGATTQAITATTSGTYTVTVTDAFNCSATASETVTVLTESTAAASATSDKPNDEICNGGNITLTANGGSLGDGADWKWYSGSCGGTLVGTGASVTVSPSSTTTYFVRAEGTCNTTTCVSITVTVTAGTPAQAVTMPFTGMPANACPGTTANLSIPPVANATMYTWDGPPGTTFDGNPSPYISTSPNATIVFGTPTTSLYKIGIQAGNSCGNSIHKLQKVRYSVSVPAAISGAVTACANTNGTYTTTASTGATSYLWTISGDATVIGNGTSVTVNFGPTWNGGTLCVAAQTNCYTSAFKCLAIGTSGTNFGVISGLFTACPNSQQNYSVTPGTGIASYNWTVPANASVISGQGTNNVTVNFDAGYNSVGNICVSATSTCGVTSALKCKTIVPGTPARPASLSGIMNGLCNALGVNYSTPSVPGITSYNWTVPSGATIVSGNGTNSINVDFSSFTTGQVCVSSTNLCGTSASRCIPVKGAPNTPVSITANPSSWCANDAGITFTADVSNVTGGYTLSWAFPPTTTYVSGGGNTTSLTLDWGASNGVVMVTASNACGAGTRTYNAVINCRESSMNADKLQVYPNPTAGMLNVTYTSEKGTTQMSLLDLSGRVIMSQSFNTVAGENTQQLDLSRIAKGAYMLNVQTHSGNHQVKIVVE